VLCGFFFSFLKNFHGCFILLMFLKEPLGKVLDSFQNILQPLVNGNVPFPKHERFLGSS
jgi:hypothetical protein